MKVQSDLLLIGLKPFEKLQVVTYDARFDRL
jgi:hypothetical protein